MENNDSPELIEKQMQETRNALTDKVATLEQQVVGTVQSATSTVQGTIEQVKETVETMKTAMQDTVSSVKDTVQDSVHSVADTVRHTFDVSAHVRNNPWAMLGGAVTAGFVTGLVVFRGGRRDDDRRAFADDYGDREMRPFAAGAPPAPAAPPGPPTWFDRLLERATGELMKLGESAFDQALQQVKQSVQQNVPKLISEVEGRIGLKSEPTPGGRANGYTV